MPYRHLQAQLNAMLLPHVHYLFAFKLSLVFSALAWLNAATFTSAANVLVGIGTILTAGYIGISYKLDKWERTKRNLDFQEQLERAKALDAARHDSLSAQLEEANARAAASAAESQANQEKMRQTLHDINNQLNAAKIENEVLRRDLTTANTNFIRVSEQLAAANSLVADLRDEVHRLSRGVESVCRMEQKAQEKAQVQAEGPSL